MAALNIISQEDFGMLLVKFKNLWHVLEVKEITKTKTILEVRDQFTNLPTVRIEAPGGGHALFGEWTYTAGDLVEACEQEGMPLHNVTFDTAVPQDWLNAAVAVSKVDYHWLLSQVVWQYPQGSAWGIPLFIGWEARHWWFRNPSLPQQINSYMRPKP